MSCDARHLDEPIGKLDPAAREYILNTIINNLTFYRFVLPLISISTNLG